jgi:hypothetical protein
MEDLSLNTESAPPKLRWYQYRLRTLLLLVSVVAVLLSLWHTYSQSEYEIVRVIENAEGRCEYEQSSIVGVNLSGADSYDDDLMGKLIMLRHLKWLIVGGHAFTDNQLERLKSQSNLEILILDSTNTTSNAEEALKKAMPRLKICKANHRAAAEFLLAHKPGLPDSTAWDPKVIVFCRDIEIIGELKDFDNTPSSFRGSENVKTFKLPHRIADNICSEIAHMSGNYRCKRGLYQGAILVNARHFFEYSFHFQIKRMTIEGNWFSDSDLDELVHLPELDTLILDGTSISSKGIERLKKLPQLSSLVIDNQTLINSPQKPN